MVVEEPGLREDERERRQRDCGPAPREHDQRHQPDEVLGREDLREGEKARDRGGEGERQAGPRVSHARVQKPRGKDGERLQHERRNRGRIGQRPAQVPSGDSGRLDHPRVIEPEPVGRE